MFNTANPVCFFKIIRDLFVQINFRFEKRIEVGKKRTQRPVANLAPLHHVAFGHGFKLLVTAFLWGFQLMLFPQESFSTRSIDLIIRI